jgi:[ribosomal protein S5]-alanine N-acetyltransferase
MRPLAVPQLTTARLVLRPLSGSDVPALFTIHSDPTTMRYWSGTVWKDEERGRAMVARDHDENLNDHLRLGIALIETGQLIGTCTLFEINDQCGRAELGYVLGSFAWGQGYMRVALRAFLSHAFAGMHLRRIEADTDPRNEPSLRLLASLGFVKEGHFRERWVVDGAVSDSAMFGLLRSEWPH